MARIFSDGTAATLTRSDWRVNIGDEEYIVIDGDTLQQANVPYGEAKKIRVKGLQVPEVSHQDGPLVDGKAQGYTAEHVGGQHAKNVLYNILNSPEFANSKLSNEKIQSVGGGKGTRIEADITNADTGEDITQYLLSKGLAKPTSWSTRADLDAYNTGELLRSLYGEKDENIANLRMNTPVNTNAWKQRARTVHDTKGTTDISGMTLANKEVLSGIEFARADENWEGDAKNPLSARFTQAYHGAVADLGGVIDAVGIITGSDTLQDFGDDVAIGRMIRAADTPWQKVQSWDDIAGQSKTKFDVMKNSLRWFGGHAVSSIPYMTAIAGGALLASATLPAGATAFAAASIPSAALHAGGIWNSLNAENKTAKNAGWAITAGAVAGGLERLGLAAVFKPSQILGKGGREAAIKYIMRRDGLTGAAAEATATATFNKAMRVETMALLTHARASATKDLIAQRTIVAALGSAGARAAQAGFGEGLTESLQEITTSLTASAINGQPKTATETLAILEKEFDDPEFWEQIKESARAGAAIGGAINVASTGFDAAAKQRVRAIYADGDLNKDLTAQQRALHSHGDKNLKGENKRVADEFNRTPSAYQGIFDSYEEPGRKRTAISRIASGESSIVGEAGRLATKSVLEPLSVITPKLIEASAALGQIYSNVSGIRGTWSGEGTERAGARKKGLFRDVGSVKIIGERHGFNWQNDKAAGAFGDKLVAYGRATDPNPDDGGPAGKPADKLTDTELDSIGIKRSEVPAYEKSADMRQNAAKLQHAEELQAIRDEFGVGSPEAKAFAKYRHNWWYTHRTVDPGKVQKNQDAFKALVKRRFAAASADGTLSPEEQALGADGYADYLTDEIINERPLTDFSLIGDKANAGVRRSRSLNLQADPAFSIPAATRKETGEIDFAEDNFFAGHDRTLDKVATKIATLNAMGNRGSKFDVLFTEADAQLAAAGYDQEWRDNYLQDLAVVLRDVSDSMTGNYKPIKNKFLNGVQATLLATTAIISLPLAMFTSIAEIATHIMSVISMSEFYKHVENTFKTLVGGIGRTFVNAKTLRFAAPGKYARVENEFFDLSQKIGVPQDAGALRRRVGTGDVIPIGQRLRNVLDTFFYATGLQGLTEVQRTVLVPSGLQVIQNRIEVLMDSFDANGVLKEDTLTVREADAYKDLSLIGMNVAQVVKDFNTLEQTNDSAMSKFMTDLQGNTVEDSDVHRRIQEEVEKGLLDFINTHIQDPNATNRPMWVQHPSFKLFTQFNSFLSATTTTLIPKMWNDGFGRALRRKMPSLAYNAFSAFVIMTLLGGASQWLKDLIKYGESSPWLAGDNSKLFVRALSSSGVLGQYEKGVDALYPLYPQRGEGIIGRAVGTALGPIGRQSEGILDIFTPAAKGDEGEEFWNDLFRLLPITATIPRARKGAVGWITGDDNG